jgi:hypothetical protein
MLKGSTAAQRAIVIILPERPQAAQNGKKEGGKYT